MKLSEDIKPISYFKAHASEIVRQVSEKQKTMVITQNGEAKAVIQDIRVYEQIQESLSLLKILAQGNQSLKEGKMKPLKKAFQDVRQKIKEAQTS